jgi:hypothetical protein
VRRKGQWCLGSAESLLNAERETGPACRTGAPVLVHTAAKPTVPERVLPGSKPDSRNVTPPEAVPSASDIW